MRMTATILALMILTACSRHVRVRENATWECTPGHPIQQPDVQGAIFRFEKNQQFSALHAAPRLCEQLRSSGKVIALEYDVWGNESGARGFRVVRIDGKAI